ncbi:Spore germination protein GerKA [Paenibacillus pasadenensis]|uniref:Spore germination protein GerKA n=1 Tax=Paenibacillus pasadenensis TaxID=217090 RepID=A0A2N5NBD2_9BACL|nr:spore germination protein [Paenibacillus pasadenensis]PLT47661.1 Spore germination protein GerKA [Paenibacillus pasadenensis]
MKKPNANRAAGTATACGNGGSAGNSAGNGGSEGERLPGREQLRQWLQGSDDVSLLDIEVEAERARPGAEAQASEAPDEVDEAEKPPRGLPEPGPPSGARPLKLTLVYCSAMADPMLLQKVVLPQARAGVPALAPEEAASARPGNMGAWQELKLPRISKEAPHTITWRDYICRMIFEANAILFCDEQQRAWSMSAGTVPGRSPSEAATEVSVRGPKDGFVEQLHTNTALIRYRLRTPGLRCEQLCVGTRSGTKAALLYEADIANPQLVDAIRDKLSGIDADDIVSTRHLQDLLVDRSWSLLPRTSYTGRPDFAVQCLAAGRAVILLDGNPTAIIAPANLFLLMKSAEDAQQNYFFVNFTRLLRYVCLLVTCFLPGLYIALAVYHVDQIPFNLLATIMNSRLGLPLSSIEEMFLALLLIEIFREAGARLPGRSGRR